MSSNGTSPNGKPVPKRLRKNNNVRLAAIFIAISAVGLYIGFTRDVPFTGGFRVNAVFSSANSIKAGSFVRIAGVNVGKVVDVSRYQNTSAAKVTMEIDDNGLPIHTDAQLKIRPRIFLEGNFFVDLRPGTPSAPTVSDGGTIPITQTSTPVQLDQVLTSLQYASRSDLQTLLQQLGIGLDTKPTPAENAQVDPEVRDTTGGEALNKALYWTPQAFKGTAIVNQGFLGEQHNDLSKFIKGLAATSTQLDKNEASLSDLITNFAGTMRALGSNPQALQQSIALLGPTVSNTYTALGNLDKSLPALSAFSAALIPAAQGTPAVVAAGIPWAKQATPLLSQAELGNVVDLLAPTTVNTAQTVAGQIAFLPKATEMSQCFAYKFLTTGNQSIVDSGTGYDFNPTSQAAYKEFWYALVGMAGESQNYDGNGQFLRLQSGGAQQQNGGPGGLSMDNVNFGVGKVFGNVPSPPLGASPKYFGRANAPDYKPNEKCVTNPVNQPVNLNDPAAAHGAADPLGAP
jgi:ABC-type transporter Mla subunit MlaD